MLAKVIAGLVTLFVILAVSIVLFFVLLLSMNGFSESDASWGLGAFIVLSLMIVLLMSVVAFAGVHILMKRGFSVVGAALISIGVGSIAGAIAEIICSMIGIAIADFVRRNF